MIWSATTAVQNGRAAKSLIAFRLSWSRRVDSNHRPADYEQAAAKAVVGDPQKQAHIRGFADADRLYQGGYIFVGVRACPMRILA